MQATQFSENLVNDSGNVPRRSLFPSFGWRWWRIPDSETESIDSEKWLFET